MNNDIYSAKNKDGGNPPSTLFPEAQPKIPITEDVGNVSFFKAPVQNIFPCAQLTVEQVWKIITSPKYQAPTMLLRSLTTKEQTRNFKAQRFDYVTFSGLFSRRNEGCLIQHSNLLTIDIDKILNAYQLREKLILNPFFETVLAFVSPSGEGVKWIIKIDLNEGSHLQWFKGIESYMKQNYKIDIDKSGKDVSRCCFLPYDPSAYINEKYRNHDSKI